MTNGRSYSAAEGYLRQDLLSYEVKPFEGPWRVRGFIVVHDRPVRAAERCLPECRSEFVEIYRKRFKRYRESLFLFLTEDGIPWNNNMAERALRHLSVQQKISGYFVGAGASEYLRLLGILQTCRFQEKSFLEFLLSGDKDLDQFKARKRR